MRPALAVLSGLALAISFPNPGWDPLIWVCFTPLLLALRFGRRLGSSSSFLLGWLTGVGFYLWAFAWVGTAAARFHESSTAIVVLGVLLFVSVHALPFGVFSTGWCWLQNRGRTSPFSTAALWVFLEWSTPKVFPWSVGTALSERLWVVQIAELTGVWGVSFVVLLVNATLAATIQLVSSRALSPRPTSAVAARNDGSPSNTWERRRAASRFSDEAGRLVAVSALLAIVCAFGCWRIGDLRIAGRDLPSIDIAVVQGGSTAGAFDPLEERQHRQTYLKLTRELTGADLVVWPESALRVDLRRHGLFREHLQHLVESLGTPLLLGSPSASGGTSSPFNAVHLLAPREPAGEPPGEPLQLVYRKQLLVPFAEAVPGAPHHTRYSAGASDGPLSVAGARLGLSICYEALFPGFFSDSVRDGADILLNVTDDAWFADGGRLLFGNEPEQHLQGAIFRAIETRRWLVRVSGSGITALIAPWGEVVDRIPYGVRATATWAVPLRADPPVYARAGDWLIGVCAAALAAIVLRISRARKVT